MTATQKFVALQQLANIQQEVGEESWGEFCRALDILTQKLIEMPMGERSASPRQYAELREAKSLISCLKFPDSTEPVRRDELAWALKCITDSYRANAQQIWVGLFEKAAKSLGIDLAQPHPIPLDLSRRISNELLLVSRRHNPSLALASAV